RAAVPVQQLQTLVVLWPEITIGQGEGAALDTVLSEAKVSRRVIATTDDAALKDFLERHARRAPLVVFGRPPSAPTGQVRFVVGEGDRRGAQVRAILDTLNPDRTLVWEPAEDRYERWVELVEDPSVSVSGTVPADQRYDLAIATDLPTPALLAA